MAQFSVYRNMNPATRARAPYLLDVQSDLLDGLDTRVVIPLHAASTLRGKTLSGLTPLFEIEGIRCVAMTPQLAGVSHKVLGEEIGHLRAHRESLIAALDLLVTGI